MNRFDELERITDNKKLGNFNISLYKTKQSYSGAGPMQTKRNELKRASNMNLHRMKCKSKIHIYMKYTKQSQNSMLLAQYPDGPYNYGDYAVHFPSKTRQ